MLRSIYAPYIYTYVHEHRHHWLNQDFAVAEGYLANRILAYCLVPVLIKMMIVNILIIVHCLVPVLIARMIVNVWVFITVSYTCDNDSNNCANHNNTIKNSKNW